MYHKSLLLSLEEYGEQCYARAIKVISRRIYTASNGHARGQNGKIKQQGNIDNSQEVEI